MKETQVIFSERIKRTSTIESFRFRPDEKIEFLPGQYLQLIFDEKNRSNSDLNKFLSFSSAPGKEYFEVTKRMSGSEFSKVLTKLKIGDRVLTKAPMGNCVFNDKYAKIGFLIGGIGITPVISILDYITSKKLDTDVCLLYSNKTKSDIAFKAQIDNWSKGSQKIKVVYSLSGEKSEDEGYTFGMIDKQFLTTYVNDIRERIFFIYGPPKMVAAMRMVCLNSGCGQSVIKVENFIGY